MPRQRKQRGYIYARAGWWTLRYRENVLENGQLIRRQLAKRICEVAPEHSRLRRPPATVVAKAEELLRPVNDGTYTPESTVNLADFVERVYFPEISTVKRASTVSGYRNRWNSQLRPRCGKFKLREFETHDGTRLLAEIARANPTLLRTTLQHLRNLLSGIFTFAIQQGYLPEERRNPMQYAVVPAAPEGADTYAYSLEEISQILMCLPGGVARVLASVAAFTGLRRSELRGLRWEDYSNGEIRVSRSVWESDIGPTKTRKSKAPVPVLPTLAKILDIWRERCGNPNSGYIFASSKGTPLNVNNLEKRVVRPALSVAGVEWHGWHAFRRGLATNLHRLGANDKTIQAILRHSKIAITMDIYVKTVSADSIRAMDLLEAALCADCAPVQPILTPVN